jgi:cell wall-associated NlpC family hydrolase
MRRAALMWLVAGFSTAGIAMLLAFAVAVAVLGASLDGCSPEAAPATSVEGPTPSAYALQSIPPERLALYERAGERFDIDWSFLASIGAQECGNGECAGTNAAGCAGPMQIAYVRGSECSPGSGPTLWETYTVNADPGHPLSVNDPADAIFTAARILRQDKGAPPTGGTFAEYHEAACHYYGSCGDATVAYAEEVMARAVQYGFTGSGAPKATSPPLAEPVSGGCEVTSGPPTPASSSRIVRVAESQLGQGEHPAGSNCTIYGPCEEWCSLFASWVWKRAGVALPGSTASYGYSGSLYSWVKEHGGRVLPPSARPAPGDTVFFGTGPTESVHVAIVRRVYSDGRITTIDGNDDHNEVGIAGPFLPSEAVVQGQHIYGYARPPTAERHGR